MKQVLEAPDTISVKEAAKRLKLGRRMIHSLIDKGRLVAYQPGGAGTTVLVDEASVRRFLAERYVPRPARPTRATQAGDG